MTLKEAYRLLRRYQDWRSGADERTFGRAGLTPSGVTETIEMILASQGLAPPLADCKNCKHGDFSEIESSGCQAKQKGECKKFEPIQEDEQ